MTNDTLPLFRLCNVDGCARELGVGPYGKGMCYMHYQRLRRSGTTDDPGRSNRRPKVQGVVTCSVDGCAAVTKASGLCNPHYKRSRAPLVWAECVICGGAFAVANHRSKSCSPACQREYKRAYGRALIARQRLVNPKPHLVTHQAICLYCGETFGANNRRSKFCSKACSTSEKRRDAGQVRQRRLGQFGWEPIDRAEVFKRDGWVCGLCGEQIDPKLQWPVGLSVSLDHIVPVSKGGPHLYSNVQAAHLICNVRKGNRVP